MKRGGLRDRRCDQIVRWAEGPSIVESAERVGAYGKSAGRADHCLYNQRPIVGSIGRRSLPMVDSQGFSARMNEAVPA
jgi:hypothetical protein